MKVVCSKAGRFREKTMFERVKGWDLGGDTVNVQEN